MKIVKQGYISRYFTIFLGASLFEYALFHLQYLFPNESFSIVFSYARYYFSEAWGFLMPAFTALLMLIAYAGISVKDAFLTGGMLALSRIAFYIFYYYMYFISLGYDSLEAIGFSALTSLVFVLLSFLESLAYFGVGYLVMRRAARAEGVPLGEYMLPALYEEDMLDVGVPATRAMAFTALAVFAVRLIYAIYSTVVFFIEYGASYSERDVTSIVLDYLLLLVLLVLTHITLCLAKKKIIKSRAYTED